MRFLEKNLATSHVGQMWRSYLALAIACFNVWFWFKFEVPSCKAHIFLLTEASPKPVIQQVYRVSSVIYFAWEAMPVLAWVLLVSVVRPLIITIRYIKADKRRQRSRNHSSWTRLAGVKSLIPRFLDFYYVKGKKNSEPNLRVVRNFLNHHGLPKLDPASDSIDKL